ncbi:hypothetical protein SAMD00019534_032160 [Acytostelium subglobosum LB1]|uniref:hypothetical protein n=1 Tax=Acytostelium subglobosum LB1 TaxID=1410327 RepID=UPI000645033D|nr:hypothetical protein SAMD00019534_032160 [Acytostelium subglobosum LB1]GAM20041.1 hypothetical protein SAMD00019534_032160 [Acytostelium subglobosum LB1]|eukprot:XP_012756803.1 hypothetical protein SAMD00019534_032160 [Acytostelium subglobosum LB1]
MSASSTQSNHNNNNATHFVPPPPLFCFDKHNSNNNNNHNNNNHSSNSTSSSNINSIGVTSPSLVMANDLTQYQHQAQVVQVVSVVPSLNTQHLDGLVPPNVTSPTSSTSTSTTSTATNTPAAANKLGNNLTDYFEWCSSLISQNNQDASNQQQQQQQQQQQLQQQQSLYSNNDDHQNNGNSPVFNLPLQSTYQDSNEMTSFSKYQPTTLTPLYEDATSMVSSPAMTYSQFLPKYGVVLNVNKNVLPPQAWSSPALNQVDNNNGNNNQSSNGIGNLAFSLGRMNEQPMNNRSNNNNHHHQHNGDGNTRTPIIGSPFLHQQQQHQQHHQHQHNGNADNKQTQQHHINLALDQQLMLQNNGDITDHTPPNPFDHWETGLEPDSLKKQLQLSPPTALQSPVVMFEPYRGGTDTGQHRACWMLLEPMHRNYYQPIMFKIPSDTNPLVTGSSLSPATVMLKDAASPFSSGNRYDDYRIYIHSSLGYSGNAKRFKQYPEPNEKALILDGNVYDGNLNPIYNCKICSEYYQTKSYFSANPQAKGKILLVKNNILTRIKDGGFVLSVKPMCCSGHNSHIPLYFHFTLSDPFSDQVVFQSLMSVNVKQWKKSIQSKTKKAKTE